jgi:hypothetical protein
VSAGNAASNSAEVVISSYFQTFNQGDFQITAALFAAAGRLLPPFASAIIGRDAIAEYLATEAKGMQALPKEKVWETLPSGELSVTVVGQVQTSLFSVNVQWNFLLSDQSEILEAKIQLLAALQELLHLNR